jgi:hypothetical protein
MPIRPDLLEFYGREWREVTRPRILERAGHCCENCGKPNHARVDTFSGSTRSIAGKRYWMFWRIRFPKDVRAFGLWFDHTAKLLPRWHVRSRLFCVGSVQAVRTIKVVLTCAHLNHIAGDDRDENLRALCQWCHLTYDNEHHRNSRGARKDEDRPLLNLQRQVEA